MKISEKIQLLRKEKGWSQEKLGEQLGLSRQAVSKWESGAAAPTVDNLVELAKVFDLSVDELLDLEKTTEESGIESEQPQTISVAGLQAMLDELGEVQRRQARQQIIWRIAAGAIAVVFAAAAIGYVVSSHSEIADLKARVDALQGQMSSIRTDVSSQMQAFTQSLQEQLVQQTSNMADFSWEIARLDLVSDRVTLRIKALPKEYYEGMSLTFTATGKDFDPISVQAEEIGGQLFQGELTMPISREIRLSATIGGQENQLLETIDDLRANYVTTQSVDVFWSASYTAGRPTVSVAPSISVSTHEARDANDPMQLVGQPVRGGYILKLGDEVLEEGELEAYETSAGDVVEDAARNLEKRDIPVRQINDVVCVVWLEDETGRRVSAQSVCDFSVE